MRPSGAGAQRRTLPPLEPRKERSAADTKRRILDAAEAEFSAKGFDGARLSNIARAAGIQQALIHHYFEDKARLHRAVLERALEAMTSGVWRLIERLRASLSASDMREIAEGIVGELIDFYAEHGTVLRIVRHDAMSGDPTSTTVIAEHLRPLFDATVRRLEELRDAGELRPGFDARQLCCSVVAMASFPFQEEPFIRAIWPVDCRSPEYLARLQREIVDMVLARITPA